MKISKINNILMYVLIWFIIYSSALNYTYLPKSFSYIKDIIIFYFVIVLIFLKKIKRPKDIGYSFYILLVLTIIMSGIGLINNTANSKIEIIVRILRYLEFFLLFFIFANMDKICTVSYKKIINWYIALSLFLIFVQIFGYFVPNPIVSIYINTTSERFYTNRISVGQPAIAVYPMIISLIWLLVFNSKKNNLIKIIALIIGVVISNSTTGIFSIIAIMLIYMFLNIDRTKLKKVIIFLILLIVTSIIAINVVRKSPQLSQIYEKQSRLLEIRINALFNNNIHDLSMEGREGKYELATKNITTWYQKLFGIGLLGYNTNGIDVGSLENFYNTMKACYGYCGEILFITFLLKHILGGFAKRKKGYGMALMLMFIVFAMHAYTLEILYLPTISYSLPLFYNYIKYKEIQEKDNTNVKQQ